MDRCVSDLEQGEFFQNDLLHVPAVLHHRHRLEQPAVVWETTATHMSVNTHTYMYSTYNVYTHMNTHTSTRVDPNVHTLEGVT